MYSTSYTVDVAAGSLRVDDAWNLFSEGALGFQVRKLPVPCWPLVASLKADLAIKRTAPGSPPKLRGAPQPQIEEGRAFHE